MYSYNQPDRDLRYAYVTAPRVYVAEYDPATPPTYDGRDMVSMSTAPTGGDWIDIGVIAAAALPLTKNYAHRELGRPKTRRKSVEISRDSRVEFTLTELIPEALSLLLGFEATNLLFGTLKTISGTPTVTEVVVDNASGIVAGTRVCTATLAANLASSINRAIVSAVDGTTLTLAGAGFQTAPSVSDRLSAYKSIEMIDPMDTIPDRSVVVFWDWIEDGYQRQCAVWYPRVAATAPFTPDFKDSANFVDLKIALEALATEQTTEDGSTQYVDRIMYMFD